MLFIERQHPVVQDIGSDRSILAVIRLGEADLGVSVDKSPLVDMPNALDVADIIGVLSAEIARVESLYLAVGRLIFFGLFEGGYLLIGQNDAVSLGFGGEGFQTFLECCRIVARPDTPRARPAR